MAASPSSTTQRDPGRDGQDDTAGAAGDAGAGSDLLDRILSSPGLSFLFSDVLLMLDAESFSRCEQVCRSWREHFLRERLWRRRLLERAARPGTYNRHLIFDRSPEFEAADVPDADPSESSRLLRRLCWRLEGGGIGREWTRRARAAGTGQNGFKPFKTTKVRNARTVRHLRVRDGVLAMAAGTQVHLVNREAAAEAVVAPAAGGGHADDGDDKTDDPARVLDGGAHRREVNVMDLDLGSDLLVAGGRDRRLTYWEVTTGRLLHAANDAHDRLITGIKIKGNEVVTSSRDHTVKVWSTSKSQEKGQDGKARSRLDVTLSQSLPDHNHSVWAVDFNRHFLVSGCADKQVRVWTRCTVFNTKWTRHCQLEDHGSGIRNLVLLSAHPAICLTGDIYGDLRAWNVRDRHLQYQVPDLEGQSWFRHSGGVVSISECAEGGFLAVAFGNHRIALYLTANAMRELPVSRTIDLEPLVDPGILRCVEAAHSQIYICNFSGKNGIVVLDVLDEEQEE